MKLNQDVSKLVESLNHPMSSEILILRNLILDADSEIDENIKWNSPNYTFRKQDRITLRIQPVKQIQIIFHRGAKKLAQPSERLVEDQGKILIWKENDRAIATFKSTQEIIDSKPFLINVIKAWIHSS